MSRLREITWMTYGEYLQNETAKLTTPLFNSFTTRVFSYYDGDQEKLFSEAHVVSPFKSSPSPHTGSTPSAAQRSIKVTMNLCYPQRGPIEGWTYLLGPTLSSILLLGNSEGPVSHSTLHWIVCVTERLWLPKRPCVIMHYSTEVEQSSVFVSYRSSMYLLYSICVLSVCMQLKEIIIKSEIGELWILVGTSNLCQHGKCDSLIRKTGR